MKYYFILFAILLFQQNLSAGIIYGRIESYHSKKDIGIVGIHFSHNNTTKSIACSLNGVFKIEVRNQALKNAKISITYLDHLLGREPIMSIPVIIKNIDLGPNDTFHIKRIRLYFPQWVDKVPNYRYDQFRIKNKHKVPKRIPVKINRKKHQMKFHWMKEEYHLVFKG